MRARRAGRALALLLLAAAALPARADPAEVFARVFAETFPFGADALAPRDRGLAVLAGAEGDWLPASVYFDTGRYDAAAAAELCPNVRYEIRRRGAFALDLTLWQGGRRASPTLTHTLVEDETFLRVPELEAFLAETYPGLSLPEIPRAQVMALLADPRHHGYAQLRLAAADVLVITVPPSRVEILTRCP